MNNNKTIKNTSYNFIFGIIGQIVTMCVGIIVPRMFIVSFGSEINGFINSINQLFVYVALLESGIGAGALQALYYPAGSGDKEHINQILAATNHYYCRTGWAYIIVIIGIAIGYPLVISSDLEYMTMCVIIFVTGIGGALPYFFHAKYKLLLQAEGKNYIISNIATINQVILAFGKVALLMIGLNVIAVQTLYLGLSLFQVIYFETYIHKNYKWINLKSKPDFSAVAQKNSVLLHQISTLIFRNTDVLFLTFFFDLQSVSIYTLYKMLATLIGALISNCLDSLSFRLGQIFYDRERFIKFHDIYETFHLSLTFSLYSIALVFFTPFLSLYTKGMDINYIIPYLPLCFVCMEILNYGRMPSGNIISFAGHFKQTQWKSLAESIINIVGNIIFMKYFGIIGVLLGTIIALLYRTNDIIIYVNHKILERSCKPIYKLWIINIIFTSTFVWIFNNFINVQLDNYFIIISVAVVVCLFVIPLQIGVSFLCRSKQRKDLFDIIKQRCNK